MTKISNFFDVINKSEDICLLAHKHPDGDSIGSILAVNEFLKSLNINVDIYIDGKIPYNYKEFISKDIIKFEYDGSAYDTAIILDCGDALRLGKFSSILENVTDTVCIDHHVTNTHFARINIVDDKLSSTGELLYNIFTEANIEITKEMAKYIYICMITDTGKFTYSNTSSNTYRIAGELIDKGIDISYINNQLYNNKPIKIVNSFIEIISNIEFYYHNKLGIAKITRSTIEHNNIDMDDVDGIVEFIREVNEVEVSCVLKEINDKKIKISLRSKNDIDVAEISQRYGGGGHKKAAGFIINKEINDSKQEIIKIFDEVFGD